MFVSIGEAALLIGVSISTLRRWEKEEKFLPSFRTCGGHRRYRLADLQKQFLQENLPSSSKRKTVAYARVSSHDQKADLERQVEALVAYDTSEVTSEVTSKCQQQDLSYEVIKDCGSGMNFNKKGLKRLVQEICLGKVEKLVLTHRDRLVRFGFPLLANLCQMHGTEIVVLNKEKERSFEEELASDIIDILTVFTSKLYGRRSHLARKVA